MKSQANCTVL